jgi:SAM-dependent methyltransferase
MIETALGFYDDVATEYYDPVRHPTCANFREASLIILKKWFAEITHKLAVVCEVGVGMSAVAELLSGNHPARDQLILIDSSPTMLRYSRSSVSKTTHLVLGDATKLPIANNEIDLLVASLGDPYNVPDFWYEAGRVLKPGRTVLFTTPAFAWADAFRILSAADPESAEFELVDGGRVCVPSWVYPAAAQRQMIEDADLTLLQRVSVRISELSRGPLSPKLLIDRGPDAEIVEGYLAAKK